MYGLSWMTVFGHVEGDDSPVLFLSDAVTIEVSSYQVWSCYNNKYREQIS